MLHLYVFYFFVICLIGVFSLGITVLTYFRARDPFVRDYLIFYSSFTASIFLNAFFSYIDANLPLVSVKVGIGLSYIDILLLHLLIFSIPLFIHRFFQVPRRRFRNLIAATCSFVLYLIFHMWATATLISEKRFVDPTIELSDLGMAAALLYCLAIAVKYYKGLPDPLEKKLAWRFLICFGIMLPFIFYDLVVTMMFSPLFYVMLSLLFDYHFLTQYLQHHQKTEENAVPGRENSSGASLEELAAKYALSPREQDVLRLLLQGCTNQQVGERLFISTNTVKTHISKIYQKVGINRRYELLSQFKNLEFPAESQEKNGS